MCPAAWHIPTDDEWTILISYLGGESVAGSKLKETGITHFTTYNTEATNETGFTGLPGGMKDETGPFFMKGEDAGWWSLTEQSTTAAYLRWVTYKSGDVFKQGYGKSEGIGVRCLKD